jgi:Zn-dependent peptidase ImmA (M78 family)
MLKTKVEISYQANELRKRLGEDVSSPIDIFALLPTQNKITLVFYPFSEHISGMSVRTSGGDQLAAINSKSTQGRQRFTAAHELYHMFIQKEFRSVVCGMVIGDSKDEEEKNADMFASYFLAPNDALRSFIENTLKKGKDRPFEVEDVVRLEQFFGMSRQASLYRLVGDGFITLEFANTLKVNIRFSARKFGFTEELYTSLPTNRQYYTTGGYIELSEKLLDRGLISTGKYEGLLLDAFRADIVYNLETSTQEVYD